VIPNAVDVRSTPRAALTGEPPRVVSVGRLKEPKDFVGLVRALKRVDAPYRAAIIGDGPDRGLVEAEIGGDERIELLGERSDVPGQLASSDVFVLASNSEGMPMSVLEAMAAGLPVVASAVGGVPELVAEAETGFLVPPRDVDALAAALQRVLADPELRRSLGAAAHARASERFDVEPFRAAHLALYRKALQRA
jgi:glycosyltransferase involved in cell wall biosynthesis